MQKITLKDIARKANVSVGLTSKALAGYSEVSQATQERIQRISRQMGYRPPSRRAAQEPADAQNTPRRLRRACLVFLNSKSSVTTYGQHWIRELSLAARQHDVRLEMSVIEPQPDDSSLREELRRCAQGVDGVMILGYLRTTMRDVIQSLDKPCVAIGNFEPGPRPVDHQVNNNNLEMAHLRRV